ncbi:MAG: polysaccharide biosynthesis protein [Clostridiales bacterium]|nr:polysaccharide biosynthesis protein [Clostridiales bacterium]
MTQKKALIKGALLLTIASILTRFIGFFYRIFLSNMIGAEGMGIYQLIFPIYALCHSITAAALQTSISHDVATQVALHQPKNAKTTLNAGLLISLSLSLSICFIVFRYADFIAIYILGEERCSDLLKIMVLAIPFSSIHSCINGYYYGLQKATVPAFSQLLEQIVRVFSNYLLVSIYIRNGYAISPSLAVWGLFLGELASSIYSILAASLHFTNKDTTGNSGLIDRGKLLLELSIPLTLNRIMLNLLQSTEAILIPSKLRLFGLDSSASLEVYGILTGMAMPFIFFPSALTGSISVLLLPNIAQAESGHNTLQLKKNSSFGIQTSLLVGILFTGIFIFYGQQMGTIIFNNDKSGSFIVTLAWLCPFLYLASTLGSILHGLKEMSTTFFHNIICNLIRIFFIWVFVPKVGINGYLWGILISQILITFLHWFRIKKIIGLSFEPYVWLVKPIFALFIGLGIDFFIIKPIPFFHILSPIWNLGFHCLIVCIAYSIVILLTNTISLKNT